MKRFDYIVTGGAGFIGSNVVKALNDRGIIDIAVVDHLNHPFKIRNIERLAFKEYFDRSDFRGLLKEGKVSVETAIVHMGACSSTTQMDEGYLDDNNFRYSAELAEWATSNGVRFVYASSAATYGDGSLGYVDDEEKINFLQPLNPYGRSKQKFDLWAQGEGFFQSIAGLKFFNVYGPGEDHKELMRSLVHKAYFQVLENGKISLFRSHREDYADGEQLRDFIYVDDAVNVVLYFLDNPLVSGLFNCGTGNARSWLDLTNALFKAMKKEKQVEFIDMPLEIRESYQYFTEADMTKLRSNGYSAPFTSVEEGVDRYVKNYLNHLT